jgi:hypothetical protein
VGKEKGGELRVRKEKRGRVLNPSFPSLPLERDVRFDSL